MKKFTLLIFLLCCAVGFSQEMIKGSGTDSPIKIDRNGKHKEVLKPNGAIQPSHADAKRNGQNNPIRFNPNGTAKNKVNGHSTIKSDANANKNSNPIRFNSDGSARPAGAPVIKPSEPTIKNKGINNPVIYGQQGGRFFPSPNGILSGSGDYEAKLAASFGPQPQNRAGEKQRASVAGVNNPQRVQGPVAISATYPLNQNEIQAEILADANYRLNIPISILSPVATVNRPMSDIIPVAGATETFSPSVGDHFFDPGGPGGSSTAGTPGNYPNCNCDTQTTLMGVSEINFEFFSVFGTFDYLRIYDGVDATGIKLYDNSTGPNSGDITLADMIASHGSSTFTSTSGNFFFFFHASSVVDYGGWDAVIVAASGGTGDTCSEENPNDFTFEDGYNCAATSSFKAANDLTVPADQDFTLENITASIFANGGITNVAVNYYADNAGLPGSLIGSQASATIVSQSVIGSNFGFNVNEVELSVTPFTFTGQSGASKKYWVQLSVTDGGNTTGVYWVVTSSSMQGSPAASFDGSWAIDDTTYDGVYIWDGTCAPMGGGSTFPEPYCGPLDYAIDVEPLTNVVVAGISNRSSEVVNGTPAHEDFTSISGNMTEGESYPIALEGNTNGSWTCSFVVYIDWNQDGILDNASERYQIGTITNSTGNDGQQVTGNIVVPSGVMDGPTRMRVIKQFGTTYPANSCTASNWGQAEDYTINVTSGGGTGDTCSEENPNDFTFENGYNCSSASAFKTANDLTVAADVDFTLENITASIFANGGITNVDVNYYADASGVPGTLIGSQSAVTITSQTVIGNNFGFDVNEVKLAVTPFTFAGQAGATSKYWVELSVTDGGATGSVFWVVTSSTMVGSPVANYDGGWANPDPLMDGVYKWEGTCEPTGGDPGDTCSEENPNDFTFENGYNCSSTSAFQTANDITVADGVDFTLENITASIFANGGITNVDVNYYSNASGLPGTLIGSEASVTITSQAVIGNNFGFDVNEVKLEVTPFTFVGQVGAPTKYWIELSVTDGGATGSVFWVVTSSSMVGSPVANYDGGWQNPDPLMDGVYKWEGTCEPTGGDPGDTCSEENPNDFTFENGYNCSSTSAFQTANDITVADGVDFTLENITASIFANGGITNVDVNYYSDASGLPGTLIGSEASVTITSQAVIGNNFGFDVNEVKLEVTPFTFVGQVGASTKYWIELSVTDGGATGSVFWVVTSSSMVGSPVANFDGGWANPDPLMDGVYMWEGTCEPTGGDPGDTCSEENPNDFTFENGYNCSSTSAFKTANDLTLDPGITFTLENITASIFANGGITNVDVTYYSNESGLPGTVIGSQNAVTILDQNVIGNNFGFDVNEIELEVNPFTFVGQAGAPTTYWIELSVTDGGATGSVFWVVTSSTMEGNPVANFDGGWNTPDPSMDGVYIWEGQCNPLSIGDNTLSGFTYYPNPTSDVLNFSSEKNIESVSLYNILGQKVINVNINSTSSSINMGSLSTGTYIMKVSIDGQIGTYKIIKN